MLMFLLLWLLLLPLLLLLLLLLLPLLVVVTPLPCPSPVVHVVSILPPSLLVRALLQTTTTAQVTHGAEAFESGNSVILTLKDQGILDEDEHGRVSGLAENDDELENVHMKEADVRVRVYRRCSYLGYSNRIP